VLSERVEVGVTNDNEEHDAAGGIDTSISMPQRTASKVASVMSTVLSCPALHTAVATSKGRPTYCTQPVVPLRTTQLASGTPALVITSHLVATAHLSMTMSNEANPSGQVAHD
jgi:hypothetical protein